MYTTGVYQFKQSMINRQMTYFRNCWHYQHLAIPSGQKKVWIAEMKIVIGGIYA
ncbi:MAG: hypothetical protein IPF52_11140 [Saprospiraceae bacterium]|nr:hypothetical protein [Saprospiraceae bacterium]